MQKPGRGNADTVCGPVCVGVWGGVGRLADPVGQWVAVRLCDQVERGGW